MLNEQFKTKIEQEAKAEAKKLTARVPIYRQGYAEGYFDGAEKYAELWQQAEQVKNRYEKALKAILGTNHDNHEKVILKVKTIANEALTPKPTTDEQA